MLYTLIFVLLIILIVMATAQLVGVEKRLAGIIALIFVLLYLFGGKLL